jgi:hypothetical protein
MARFLSLNLFVATVPAANPGCGGSVRLSSRRTLPVESWLAARRKPLDRQDDFTALLVPLAKHIRNASRVSLSFPKGVRDPKSTWNGHSERG